MQLNDVSPCFPIDDAFNSCLRNTVFFSQFYDGKFPNFVAFSDKPHLLRCEFCEARSFASRQSLRMFARKAIVSAQNLLRVSLHPVGFASRLTPANNHVGPVFRLSSDLQMLRITTLRVIAIMQHEQVIGNWPNVQFVRKAVRSYTPRRAASAYRKFAVPVFILSASPFPTCPPLNYANTFPEALLWRGVSILVSQGVNLQRLGLALVRPVRVLDALVRAACILPRESFG